MKGLSVRRLERRAESLQRTQIHAAQISPNHSGYQIDEFLYEAKRQGSDCKQLHDKYCKPKEE
jgi:hypothetical protein